MNEMKNNSLQDELKDTPLLGQLLGKNPYRIPEHYFETLAGRIEKRIEHKPVVVRRISFSRMAARFAAAATVVLFIGAAGWLYLYKNNSVKEDILLTPDQISNSVYFDDIDLTLLKDEAATVTDEAATDDIEKYLLEHDLTFLIE